MEITIECQKRPEGSKPNALRRSGKIPANLYGHNGAESISLIVDTKVIERLLKQIPVSKAGFDSKKAFEVSIPELNWRGGTVIREVQKNPAKGSLYHISFFAAKG
jgi:large subunit ribosomal protein L25